MLIRCRFRLIINIESFLLLGNQDGVDSLDPLNIEQPLSFWVGNGSLSVRQSVLQFSLVRNGVIVVINSAESCPLVVGIVANIPISHLASVLSLPVLLSVCEIALVNSQRLRQST